ncbi:GntR family transcriptional regulator [Micromonospora carbonacea]|uniref:GntR family transcriptional regulator n=1 Tax=Micromonospora carbonacea TaxID=47853 RepID=UPI003D7130E7
MSPVPRYRRLAVILRKAIDAGEYPPGSRLPSEKTSTQTYGVARETASKAMDALAADGLARHGSRRGLARPARGCWRP